MSDPDYPDDLNGADYCIIEGCDGPNCSRCGTVNYHWLGYCGAVARWAKAWGVTRQEAEKRIEARRSHAEFQDATKPVESACAWGYE